LNNYAIKTFDRKDFVGNQANARRTAYYEKINERIKQMTPPKMGKMDVIYEYVYNKETLGFRLDSKDEIEMYLNPNAQHPAKEIKTFFSYTKALINTLIDFQNNVHLHSDDWQRTIYINTFGVEATDFDITDAKKNQLVEAGRGFTQDYLDWYNNDEAKANK
jgi:NTE family protein